MTEFFRKYYNQRILSDHRRNWLQREKPKKEQRVERQRQGQKPDQKSQNPNQNLKPRKSHLVDIRLASPEEKKPSNRFLEKEISLQVK